MQVDVGDPVRRLLRSHEVHVPTLVVGHNRLGRLAQKKKPQGGEIDVDIQHLRRLDGAAVGPLPGQKHTRPGIVRREQEQDLVEIRGPRTIERAHRARHEDRDRGARQGNARDAPLVHPQDGVLVHLGAVPWFHITVLVPPECEQEQHHVMVLQLRSETALHAIAHSGRRRQSRLPEEQLLDAVDPDGPIESRQEKLVDAIAVHVRRDDAGCIEGFPRSLLLAGQRPRRTENQREWPALALDPAFAGLLIAPFYALLPTDSERARMDAAVKHRRWRASMPKHDGPCVDTVRAVLGRRSLIAQYHFA